MTIQYNVPGSKRKELVKTIAAWLGEDIKYCGAPTFAYEVDYFGDLLYSTWGLNPECNYRTTGKLVSSKGKVMLLFNFSDAEMWKTKKAGI